MAYAQVQYAANGSTTSFPITFAYLDPTNVQVSIGSTSYTYGVDYTIQGGNVVFQTAPSSGLVNIQRATQSGYRLVNFQDASVLTETDLDTSHNQLFYLLQEALDAAGRALPADVDNNYNAGSKRIKNVATPVDSGDAVPKSYVDPVINTATTKATAAAASATAAAASATAAQAAASQVQAGLGLSKLIGFYVDSGNNLQADDTQSLSADSYVDWAFVPATVSFTWSGNDLLMTF